LLFVDILKQGRVDAGLAVNLTSNSSSQSGSSGNFSLALLSFFFVLVILLIFVQFSFALIRSGKFTNNSTIKSKSFLCNNGKENKTSKQNKNKHMLFN
jgi:hypothetical protein